MSLLRPARVSAFRGIHGVQVHWVLFSASCLDGTPQYFALTCSHVLSCTYLFILGPFPRCRTLIIIGSHIYLAASKLPTKPGSSSSSEPDVVCPADRDNLHWWLAAENVIKFRSTAITRIQAAQGQKLRCKESRRLVGTMYASPGLRASIDHWVLDWALIKLNPTRFAYKRLCNVRFTTHPYVFLLKLTCISYYAESLAFQLRDV